MKVLLPQSQNNKLYFASSPESSQPQLKTSPINQRSYGSGKFGKTKQKLTDFFGKVHTNHIVNQSEKRDAALRKLQRQCTENSNAIDSLTAKLRTVKDYPHIQEQLQLMQATPEEYITKLDKCKNTTKNIEDKLTAILEQSGNIVPEEQRDWDCVETHKAQLSKNVASINAIKNLFKQTKLVSSGKSILLALMLTGGVSSLVGGYHYSPTAQRLIKKGITKVSTLIPTAKQDISDSEPKTTAVNIVEAKEQLTKPTNKNTVLTTPEAIKQFVQKNNTLPNGISKITPIAKIPITNENKNAIDTFIVESGLTFTINREYQNIINNIASAKSYIQLSYGQLEALGFWVDQKQENATLLNQLFTNNVVQIKVDSDIHFDKVVTKLEQPKKVVTPEDKTVIKSVPKNKKVITKPKPEQPKKVVTPEDKTVNKGIAAKPPTPNNDDKSKTTVEHTGFSD